MMTTQNNSLVIELNARLEKYQAVLNIAETENNSGKVRRYKRILAQYEKCIKDVGKGIVSLADLPNPPGFPPLVENDNSLQVTAIEQDINPSPLPSPLVERKLEPEEPMIIVNDEAVIEDEGNVVDKLQLRLQKYEVVLSSAEAEGAAAKVRRYKRIISQYSDAIKSAKAGKEVDLSELPNPPGLPPLVPVRTPVPSPQPSPLPSRSNIAVTNVNVAAPVHPPQITKILSRADKQTALLRERQKEYRDAALAAKKSNQLPEAKEFLKISKGFDRLILASESGLPVDLSTIPVSLHAVELADEAYHFVTEKDFAENSDNEVFDMLKNELQEQINSCILRKNQSKATGDVANANRFDQWALTFKKDLNKVTIFQNSGQPIPKFHYEQKSFPVVHCFSEIAAGDIELSIIQAVSLAKVADTYVGYEFPYPTESPPSGYTSVIKNSVNPTFNHTLAFPIDRDSKPCQRMFKRHGIKLELWARGGFLRKDVSLGTVVVKLLPLTTDIMIHDAFDLMNGRRPTGGKLEVKVRIREPILAKKIDTITEKWLILD